MGTYAWVAAGAVLLIALVLRFGPSLRPPRAQLVLPADGPFTGAALQRDGALLELGPGGRLELAAGRWRVRLFRVDGGVEERALELADGEQHVLGPR